LLALHKDNQASSFAQLLLGISDPTGNYSAHEHGIGPRVLADNLNSEKRIFSLGTEFLALQKARIVPALIRQAHLTNLGIGVGSEASCMLNPEGVGLPTHARCGRIYSSSTTTTLHGRKRSFDYTGTATRPHLEQERLDVEERFEQDTFLPDLNGSVAIDERHNLPFSFLDLQGDAIYRRFNTPCT
jgi:hypothetical protein